MTMKEREIKYGSLCMNIETHIWTSFNRNKKNTGCSTIHLFNIHLLGMLCPRCGGSSREHGRHNSFSHRLLQGLVHCMNSLDFSVLLAEKG